MDRTFIIASLVIIIAVVAVYFLFLRKKSHSEKFSCSEISRTIEDPPEHYWFLRADGKGTHQFNTDGLYLRQEIYPPEPTYCIDGQCPSYIIGSCVDNSCLTYTNSEIYNNPCCAGEIDKICQVWEADTLTLQKIYQACMDLDKKIVPSNPLYPIIKGICGLLDVPDPQGTSMILLKKQLCQLVKLVCGTNMDKDIGEVPQENLPGRCNLVVNPAVVDSPYTNLLQMIQDIFLNVPYRYAKMSCRMRVKNLKNGSRGWGFWNTMDSPTENQFAWFMQQDGICPSGADATFSCPPGQPYPLNGFYIMILLPLTSLDVKTKVIKLPDLDEEFHDYVIDWKKDSIDFYMDDVLVHSETEAVPYQPMAFHSWVDNSIFGLTASGFTHWVQKMTEVRGQDLSYLQFDLYKNGESKPENSC